jgi:hypothetical protein
MSNNNGKGRRIPFPASGRIPIVGERPTALPEGRHYYHVPALIQRPGQPLEADAFEAYFAMPINGVYFSEMQADITKKLTKEGEEPPKVILLQPVFLGFIPQEELDRREREAAEAAKAQEIVLQ